MDGLDGMDMQKARYACIPSIRVLPCVGKGRGVRRCQARVMT